MSLTTKEPVPTQEIARRHWEARGRPRRDDWADWFWAESLPTYVRLGFAEPLSEHTEICARRGQPVGGPRDGTVNVIWRKNGGSWTVQPMTLSGASYGATLPGRDLEFYLLFRAIDGSQHFDGNVSTSYKASGSILGHSIFLRGAIISQEADSAPTGRTLNILDAHIWTPQDAATAVYAHARVDGRWITLQASRESNGWPLGIQGWRVYHTLEAVPGPVSPTIPVYPVAVSSIDVDGHYHNDDNFGCHYQVGAIDMGFL